MSYVNMPLCWPFKMVTNDADELMHFDSSWTQERLKSYELKTYYRAPWLRGKTTPLQVEANIYPGDLLVYDPDRNLIKTFAWTVLFDAGPYKIYHTTFDLSDKPEGKYFNWMDPGFNIKPFISEPYESRNKFRNVLPFEFRNSFNKDGMAWTAWASTIKMLFCCEAGITEPDPDRDRTAYQDQPLNVETLYATATRAYKLLIAEAPGVAPYMLDILNRVFCCDEVIIKGKQYETPLSSKWEITKTKGRQQVGASIDLVEAQNPQVLQHSNGDEGSGFVTAYNLETGFFGPGTTVPVLEVEH